MTSLQVQLSALHSKFIASNSGAQRLAYLEAAFIALDSTGDDELAEFEKQLSSTISDDESDHMRRVVTSMCLATVSNGKFKFLTEEPYGRWKTQAACKAGLDAYPNSPDLKVVTVKRPAQRLGPAMSDEELPPTA